MIKEREIIHDDTRNIFLQNIQWCTQNYASSHATDRAVAQAEKMLIDTQRTPSEFPITHASARDSTR